MVTFYIPICASHINLYITLMLYQTCETPANVAFHILKSITRLYTLLLDGLNEHVRGIHNKSWLFDYKAN